MSVSISHLVEVLVPVVKVAAPVVERVEDVEPLPPLDELVRVDGPRSVAVDLLEQHVDICFGHVITFRSRDH